MKSLVTTAVISIALLAAAPAVPGSPVLHAQAEKPKEQPKPQPSNGGKAAPQPAPAPPSRPAPPAADRPKPPQSTGEPELKRRKQ